MTDQIQQARRSAFEAAYKKETERHCQGAFSQAVFARANASGDYIIGAVQAAWWGFNAALDSLCIELPLHIEYTGSGEAIEACRAAIKQTNMGIKIK